MRKVIVWSVAAVLCAMVLGRFDQSVQAATSAGCEGGGFSIVLPGGAAVGGTQETTVAAANLGASFVVRGRYVEFQVVSATFGIVDYAFTGAPNALDITGGVRTPVFARKTPNHRGLVLNGAMDVEIGGGDVARRERRAHGRGVRRGRDGSRAARDDLHPPVPGAEPGPRPVGRARLPVPGAGYEPAATALPCRVPAVGPVAVAA